MILSWILACTPDPPAAGCRASKPQDPPDDLPVIKVLEADPSRSEVLSGHLLLTQYGEGSSYAVALEGCGELEWWAPASAPDRSISYIRRGLDGASVLIGENHRDPRVDVGLIRRVSIATGEELSRTRAEEHHHAFVEVGDGRLAWLSRERIDNEWFPQHDAMLATDIVRIGPEGSELEADAEVLFRSLQDTGLEPFWTCSHMEPGRYLPDSLDWTHANSLVLDRDTGEYTLMLRHWDALLRLSPDGQLRWILGGPAGTLTPLGGAIPPRHAHLTEAWSDGVLVFDNRNHANDATSRAVWYGLDEEGLTYEERWVYPDPNGVLHPAQGDVRSLPGGNFLISWTPAGRLTEVTPEGEIVWKAEAPGSIGRVEFFQDWP
ncbi:MAG TPA: hypothetical protein ENK18_11020 [Deltaproteobacteria bacterium]|nr:hypothetical protein [Deltaproteobacteria bacterium]